MIAKRLFARSASVIPRTSSWTCPSCVRKTPMVVCQQRRNVTLPTLSPEKASIFIEQGVPRLLSASGYDYAWTQYETMLVEKLSELVAGDPMEHQSPKQILMQTARDPMQASIFNYASMAHNNHFFFESLSTDPSPLAQYPYLQQVLEKSFGTIETLRITMIDTAASMFGPGFVWLVYCADLASPSDGHRGAFRILTTYNAGTPYPEAGYRQQGIDMNTNNEQSFQQYQRELPANTSGIFGAHSESGQRQAMLPPGSTAVCPVLCVSTWEHVYLRDFGPAGKRKFIEQWWDRIEWNVVNGRVPERAIPADPRFTRRYQTTRN